MNFTQQVGTCSLSQAAAVVRQCDRLVFVLQPCFVRGPVAVADRSMLYWGHDPCAFACTLEAVYVQLMVCYTV
jgi:hypothetical protein